MGVQITPKELAAYFDHTQLRAYAVHEDFVKLCKESMDYGFAMVAINPAQVVRCCRLLKGSEVHVGAAVGFPLGQTTVEDKCNETQTAIANGADEIDYVINITELKEKNYSYIEEEMAKIVQICRESNVISKVIFENCYLTDPEKEEMCRIALNVRPDYIKTSTGFGTGGATREDVALFAKHVGPDVKIKAAGGIADLKDAEDFINLGASRLGTSRIVKAVKAMEEK